MKTPDFKIVLTILVFVITLGVLVGGNKMYQQYLVNQPLENNLAAVPGIERAEIARQDAEVVVTVHLRDIDNLQEEYTAIDKVLKNSLNKHPYHLVIADNNNDKLHRAFVDLQPAVYEALASQRYVWLNESVKAYADQTGIRYQLYVDERYLYLTLSDNGDSLYRVIERQNDVQDIS